MSTCTWITIMVLACYCCLYAAVDSHRQSLLTQTLQDIYMQVSQNNVSSGNITSVLDNLTIALNMSEGYVKDKEDVNKVLTAGDVDLVTDILVKIVDLNNVSFSEHAAEQVLEIVSKVSVVQESVLRQARAQDNTTNRLLETVDKLSDKVTLEGRAYVTLNSSTFKLKIWDVKQLSNDTALFGLRLTANTQELEDILCEKGSCCDNIYDVSLKDTDTAILIPRHLLVALDGSDIRISANIITGTSLFDVIDDETNPSSKTTSTASASHSESPDLVRRLHNKIVSLRITEDGQPITNLSAFGLGPYVTTFFTIKEPEVTSHDTHFFVTCAFWDYGLENRTGAWSTEGCSHIGFQDDLKYVCRCSHLTNFALLMGFQRDRKSPKLHEDVLSLLSQIFLSMSIFGLSITIFSFLRIKSVRVKAAQQTVFSMSVAMLLSWLLFLTGFQHAPQHRLACMIVAGLLHLTIMASFMWMLVMGVLQYLMLVQGMQTIDKFWLKASVPAWGVPVVTIIIVASVDVEMYNSGEDFCFLSPEGFHFAFLPLVGLVIVSTANIYVIVLTHVCCTCRRDMARGGVSYNVISACTSVAAFVVLGLSWAFAFTAMSDVSEVFQYLFTTTAALQGFLVFLLFTARDPAVQTYWRNVLRYDQIIARLRSLRNPARPRQPAEDDSQSLMMARRGNSSSSGPVPI